MIFISTYALLWVLAIAMAAVVCVLIRQLSEVRILAANSAPAQKSLPALGSSAPEFSAVDLRSGKPVHSSELRGRRIVICMVSTGCRSCIDLMDDLARFDVEQYSGLVLYCHGEADSCLERTERISPAVTILSDDTSHLTHLFQIPGLPAAVTIDAEWKIVGYRYPKAAGDVVESLQRRPSVRVPELHVA